MNDLPETMQASVLQKIGTVTTEERPVPQPAPGEVLIKVGSVGVCGSDVHYFETGRIGDYVLEEPMILGHEAGGVIVAVGDGVDAGRIGERVSIEPQKPCRKCGYCKSGRYNLCPEMEFYATPPIDGAFCEYVTIGDDFAFPVSDAISDDAAGLMEPLSVAIAAVQKANLQNGQTVLIAGAGPIGIITAQVAKAFGASKVSIVDLSETRRNFALQFGVDQAFDPTSPEYEDVSADVFIDASGSSAAIQAGLARTRPGGCVVLVGSADVVPFSVPEIAMREVDVTGIFRYTNTWPIAIDLVERGLVQLDPLVTTVYGLDQVEQALTDKTDPTTMKRIIRPGVSRI